MYVHLGYGFDAAKFRARFDRGESSEYTPYDFHLAERPGVTIAFSSDGGRRPPGRIMRGLNRRLQLSLDHAWHNRRAIAASDVVWTMSEYEAFAVAILMRLGIVPRRPIIGAAIWLFDRWPRLPVPLKMLFRWASREVDILTVHSSASMAAASQARLHSRVQLSLFGINGEVHQPLAPNDKTAGPIHVLSAGNDASRDWPLLLDAFGNDERFVLSAWTSSLGVDDLARYANLRLPKPSSPEGVRRMYRDSDVVVVAMTENIYSGITVALESAAQNRPVIATRTGGIPTYFSEDEVCFVDVGDAGALREAASKALDRSFAERAVRARRRFVEGGYATRDMIDRYLSLTRPLIAGSSADGLAANHHAESAT